MWWLTGAIVDVCCVGRSNNPFFLSLFFLCIAGSTWSLLCKTSSYTGSNGSIWVWGHFLLVLPVNLTYYSYPKIVVLSSLEKSPQRNSWIQWRKCFFLSKSINCQWLILSLSCFWHFTKSYICWKVLCSKILICHFLTGLFTSSNTEIGSTFSCFSPFSTIVTLSNLEGTVVAQITANT